VVTVPAFALHHMDEYYPDPEKFDPERLIPFQKEKTTMLEIKLTLIIIFKVGSRK
jgi:cytochrome P450